MSAPAGRLGWRFVVLVALSLPVPVVSMAMDRDSGRELFTREWLPDDPRSANGDGLGPVFNDTSCAACHNQGGVGGAGPASKNVQVASAFSAGIEVNGERTINGPNFNFSFDAFGFKFDEGGKKKVRRTAKSDKAEAKAKVASEREQLERIHPGLLSSRSVVLQRFSTDAAYASYRDRITGDGLTSGFDGKFPFGGDFDNAFDFFNKLSGQAVADRANLPKLSAEQSAEMQRVARQSRVGGFFRLLGQRQIGNIVLLISERNTPPLFGAGLIDAIPDSVLINAAKARHPGYPEVSGRVARQKDGKLGRFGWKSQKVDLREFTLNACAMELGLDVPTQPQAMVPHKPDYVAPGFDLTEDQCDELVVFVSELPRPQQVVPSDEKAKSYLAGGRMLFDSVGCAVCHVSDLGEVKDLYSDLLLHDMGASLGDVGAYGSVPPNATDDEELAQPLPPLVTFGAPGAKRARAADEAKLIGALRQEWRTPPLWGLRDSGPYLHDGRATTIEQAVALHDGEAQRSARQFFKLSADEKLQLTSFLKSLAAP